MTFGMHHAWRARGRAPDHRLARRPGARPGHRHRRSRPRAGASCTRIARWSAPTSRSACSRSRAPSCAARGERAASRCWPPTRSRCPSRTRTFACVMWAFLLRNLADLEQGLAEMRRVTAAGRAGGRARDHAAWRAPGCDALFGLYFHRVVPRDRPARGRRSRGVHATCRSRSIASSRRASWRT